MLSTWLLLGTVLGGIATIAIYSFLYKENIFYRFFEHLYIGIAAGFFPVLAFKNFLWPKILKPMFGYDVYNFPDGTVSHEPSSLYFLYIIPALFGLLYYTLYIKRFSWMLKLVIGFSLGAAAGLTFKGFFPEILPQITKSFRPLVVFENSEINWITSFENIFFIFTLLSVMYYFFFTIKREGRVANSFAYAGRWLMMICFGAFFGSTVMARMALLVERIKFLAHDWVDAIQTLIG